MTTTTNLPTTNERGMPITTASRYRIERAVAHRNAGMTYEWIAQECGYRSPAVAAANITRYVAWLNGQTGQTPTAGGLQPDVLGAHGPGWGLAAPLALGVPRHVLIRRAQDDVGCSLGHAPPFQVQPWLVAQLGHEVDHPLRDELLVSEEGAHLGSVTSLVLDLLDQSKGGQRVLAAGERDDPVVERVHDVMEPAFGFRQNVRVDVAANASHVTLRRCGRLDRVVARCPRGGRG